MTRPPARHLAARYLAARKSKAGMPSGRGRERISVRTATPIGIRKNRGTGVRPAEPRVQVRDVSPELADLPGQVIDSRGAFGKRVGTGADEDAFTGVANHEPVLAELSHRRPDHRGGDAVRVAQFRGGRDGRSDRQFTGRDLPPEVGGHPLVCGTRDWFGHLAILLHLVTPLPSVPQSPLTTWLQLTNLIHKDEHSVIACCALLGTPVDAYAPAVITGEISSPDPGAEDVSMQQVISASGPPVRDKRRPGHASHLLPTQP